MYRRTFMVLVGAAAGFPLAGRAQQKRIPVVGFLHSAAPGQLDELVAGFQAGLKESGYSEGQNVTIEYRWAENDYERLPKLAADLVSRKVDVIAAAGGDRSAVAAKGATSAIPIACVIGGDPVATGLVASLARPGGNLTGVSFLTASLTPKRFELLMALVPQAKLIGLLANPKNPQTPGVVTDLRQVVQVENSVGHVVRVKPAQDVTDERLARNRHGAFRPHVRQRPEARSQSSREHERRDAHTGKTMWSPARPYCSRRFMNRR